MKIKTKRKKKEKNNNIKKYTCTTNHTFSKNISRILDLHGKTSKNTFNHYLFCHKFYELYKEKIYEEVFTDVLLINKLNSEFINNLIQIKFKKYFELYKSDHKTYISNNNIIYQCIKSINLKITNKNFVKTYNSLVKHCVILDKLILNTPNLLFLYEQNIFTILTSFYYYKYYNVKNGLINKKPIKVEFDEEFKNHVMTTDKPEQFVKKVKYLELINKMLDKDDKLSTERNFISKLVYSTIEFDKTSSDIICNAITKANETISSYYNLRKNGLKANKPRYIKDDFYSIIFCGKTIKLKDKKHINDKQIRLLYGDFITSNWQKYFNEELNINPIFKIKKPSLLNKNENQLKQVEIKKISERVYKVHYKIDKPKPNVVDESKIKINEMISIDLGMKNLLTIHDPNGKQRIVKGGCLISLNEYYAKKIGVVQSKKDLTNDKQLKSSYEKEIELLNDMRLRKLNGKMNDIIIKLKELYPDKKAIIIGYNEGWKDKMNLGKNTNRKFYQIPYARLLNKIRYSFDGKAVVKEINEAYTSKCDSLNLEKVEKHEEYKGKRVKRGLFSSGAKQLLNADLNGAINILRKYTEYKYDRPSGLLLCNPECITP